MARISVAFEHRKAFIAFITGGDPDIETTEALIPQMAAAGADIIAIGIPFSDPISEGIVIQQADERALRAGTTTDKLLDMVKRVRKKVTIPLVFMTYINPVFTYGTKHFFEKCAECGIDGVVIPDVPFEEREEVNGACVAAGIELITMIAPTSRERIDMISRYANGFLYCMSPLGVPEVRSKTIADLKEMINHIKEVSNIPCAISFGITTPEQAQEIATVSDGTIVGSAIVQLIAQNGKNCIEPVCQYVRKMKEAVASA